MDTSVQLSDQQAAAAAAGAGIVGLIMTIIYLAVLVLFIAAMWKIFTKAGKPGWAAIIPIYNIIVLLEVIGRPLWWILLLLIPFVNIVVLFIVMIDLAKSFGKDPVYGIGLALLSIIFLPMLGFGASQYVGPSAAVAAPAPYYPPQQPTGYAPPAAPPSYSPPAPPPPPGPPVG